MQVHRLTFEKSAGNLRNHQEILNCSEVGPLLGWSPGEFSCGLSWSCVYNNLHPSFTLEISIYNPTFPLSLFFTWCSVYHALNMALRRSKWIMSSWSSVRLETNVISTMGSRFRSVLFESQIDLHAFIETQKILDNFIIYFIIKILLAS